MHSTHTGRFVVFQFQNEWLVTYGDCTQISFLTREDVEASAFNAADALASQGQAVSVLILPSELDANGQHPMALKGYCSSEATLKLWVDDSPLPGRSALGMVSISQRDNCDRDLPA